MHHVPLWQLDAPVCAKEDSDYETTAVAHDALVNYKMHPCRSKQDAVHHDTSGADHERVVPTDAGHENDAHLYGLLAVAELPPFVDPLPPYPDEYAHGLLQYPGYDSILLASSARYLRHAPRDTEPTAKCAANRWYCV